MSYVKYKEKSNSIIEQLESPKITNDINFNFPIKYEKNVVNISKEELFSIPNSKYQTTSKRIRNVFNNILFTIFIIMSLVYPLIGILLMADVFSWNEYSSDIEWSTFGYGIIITLFIIVHSINSAQRKSLSKKIKEEKNLIRSRDDKEFLPVELESDDFNVYYDIISNKDKFVDVDKFPQEYINNAVKYNMIIVFQSNDKIPDNTESCDMFLSSSYTAMIVLKDQNLVLRKLFNFMKKHERRERNRGYYDVRDTIDSPFAEKIFSFLFKLDVLREEVVETGNHESKSYVMFGSRYDWFVEKYCEINHLMWK